MPKLHILSGVLEGKVFDLTEERITLGRALDNVIRLEDGTVSHHHALLVSEGLEYKLRDLNSTNGTRVNGLRIVDQMLQNGDQVRLGSVEMRYASETKKASQPLPPTQTGVSLTELGHGAAAPPPTFSTTSPFGRKKRRGLSPWVWVVIGLGVIAMIVVAVVILSIVGLPSTNR
jgi:hypothetical protein